MKNQHFFKKSMLIWYYFNIFNVYCISILFERQRHMQIFQLTSQMFARAKAGPSQTQKPGNRFGSATWAAGTKAFEPFSFYLPVYISAGSWIETGVAKT